MRPKIGSGRFQEKLTDTKGEQCDGTSAFFLSLISPEHRPNILISHESLASLFRLVSFRKRGRGRQRQVKCETCQRKAN